MPIVVRRRAEPKKKQPKTKMPKRKPQQSAPTRELFEKRYREGVKPTMKRDELGPRKMKKAGGSLKPVDKKKNPGLAKLPTKVRNKMGYMKKGGMAKKGMSR